MEIEIRNRYTNEIILCGEYQSLKDCLEKNRDASLSYVNLRGANLRDADLIGAYLRGADLRGANLRDANLRDADLSYADLRGAYLRGADLRGAYLRGANLRGANLRDANLSYANLRDADLIGAYLRGADFYGEKIDKQPLQILGLEHYDILITKEHIKIGCEIHKAKDWKEFDDKRILEMDGKKALKWWKENKDFIFMCHKKHCGEQSND